MAYSPSTQTQLQGSARVIKDHCADWHNLIEKWDTLNSSGFQLINKIINSILQSRSQTEAKPEVKSSHEAGLGYAGDMSEGNEGIPQEVESHCQQLTQIHTSMAALVDKASAITKHFRGVEKLEGKKGRSGAQFQTWPISRFVQSSQELEDMYHQELAVKRVIIEDVAHHDNRDVMMTYASCWLHQPYITDEATLILEGMLTETGFR